MNTIWADLYGVHDALETVGILHARLSVTHPEVAGEFSLRPGDLKPFARCEMLCAALPRWSPTTSGQEQYPR